jgi:hypothetical protein
MSPVSPVLTWKRRTLLLVGALAVIGAGIVVPVLFLQAPPEDLARLVPAARTVAYFRQTSVANARRYAGLFPELSTLPPLSFDVTLAVLATAPDQRSWVLAPADPKDAAALQSNLTVGTHRLIASSAGIAGLLDGSHEPLSSSSLYRSLAGRVSAGAVYLPFVPPEPLLNGLTLEFLHAADARAMIIRPRVGGGGDILLATGSGTLRPPLSSAQVPALSPAADLLVTTGDAGALLQASFALRNVDPRLTLATLSADATQALGPDVSMQYDILPLLHGPSLLARDDARKSFLLAGEAADEKTLIAVLDRIRASALQTLGAGAVEHTQFDEQFSTTLIREDAGHVRQKEEDLGGWDVRSVGQKTGSGGIFLARHGRKFALSNSRSWTEQYVASAPDPLPNGGRAWLGGRIVMTQAFSWISSADAALLRSALDIPTDGRFLWSVAAGDGLTTLMIRP